MDSNFQVPDLGDAQRRRGPARHSSINKATAGVTSGGSAPRLFSSVLVRNSMRWVFMDIDAEDPLSGSAQNSPRGTDAEEPSSESKGSSTGAPGGSHDRRSRSLKYNLNHPSIPKKTIPLKEDGSAIEILGVPPTPDYIHDFIEASKDRSRAKAHNEDLEDHLRNVMEWANSLGRKEKTDIFEKYSNVDKVSRHRGESVKGPGHDHKTKKQTPGKGPLAELKPRIIRPQTAADIMSEKGPKRRTLKPRDPNVLLGELQGNRAMDSKRQEIEEKAGIVRKPVKQPVHYRIIDGVPGTRGGLAATPVRPGTAPASQERKSSMKSPGTPSDTATPHGTSQFPSIPAILEPITGRPPVPPRKPESVGSTHQTEEMALSTTSQGDVARKSRDSDPGRRRSLWMKAMQEHHPTRSDGQPLRPFSHVMNEFGQCLHEVQGCMDRNESIESIAADDLKALRKDWNREKKSLLLLLLGASENKDILPGQKFTVDDIEKMKNFDAKKIESKFPVILKCLLETADQMNVMHELRYEAADQILCSAVNVLCYSHEIYKLLKPILPHISGKLKQRAMATIEKARAREERLKERSKRAKTTWENLVSIVGAKAISREDQIETSRLVQLISDVKEGINIAKEKQFMQASKLSISDQKKLTGLDVWGDEMMKSVGTLTDRCNRLVMENMKIKDLVMKLGGESTENTTETFDEFTGSLAEIELENKRTEEAMRRIEDIFNVVDFTTPEENADGKSTKKKGGSIMGDSNDNRWYSDEEGEGHLPYTFKSFMCGFQPPRYLSEVTASASNTHALVDDVYAYFVEMLTIEHIKMAKDSYFAPGFPTLASALVDYLLTMHESSRTAIQQLVVIIVNLQKLNNPRCRLFLTFLGVRRPVPSYCLKAYLEAIVIAQEDQLYKYTKEIPINDADVTIQFDTAEKIIDSCQLLCELTIDEKASFKKDLGERLGFHDDIKKVFETKTAVAHLIEFNALMLEIVEFFRRKMDHERGNVVSRFDVFMNRALLKSYKDFCDLVHYVVPDNQISQQILLQMFRDTPRESDDSISPESFGDTLMIMGYYPVVDPSVAKLTERRNSIATVKRVMRQASGVRMLDLNYAAPVDLTGEMEGARPDEEDEADHGFAEPSNRGLQNDTIIEESEAESSDGEP